MIQSILKTYKSLTNIGKVMVFITLFLILFSIFEYFFSSGASGRREGFHVKRNELVFKDNETLYDDFYSNVYDDLFFNDLKDDYQIGTIVNKTTPTEESNILDIGSGTGHIVNKLNAMGFPTIGLDNSSAMIKKSKKNFPNHQFIKGDVSSSQMFPYNSFTHILCLYFTIYYLPNKFTFFENCFRWLRHGGYCIVHLVEPMKFDPLNQSSNPLFLLSPQRYAPKRLTKSKIVFNDFNYQSDFNIDAPNNSAVFIEKFSNKDDNTTFLRNEHKLYMESIDTILQKAQEVGFIVSSKIDMVSVQYEYQYLYVFQKP